jgi:hypothetical protein
MAVQEHMGGRFGEMGSEPIPAATNVEPSSWWPFVALFLGAFGCFGVLVVHLMIEAKHAGTTALAWMALPGLFFCGSAAALFMSSGMTVRERVAAVAAGLLGYSPPERKRQADAGSQDLPSPTRRRHSSPI